MDIRGNVENRLPSHILSRLAGLPGTETVNNLVDDSGFYTHAHASSVGNSVLNISTGLITTTTFLISHNAMFVRGRGKPAGKLLSSTERHHTIGKSQVISTGHAKRPLHSCEAKRRPFLP